MKTVHLAIRPLRGIDQRWRPDPFLADRLQDLRWVSQDAWRTAGGFRSITDSYFQPDMGPGNQDPWANQGKITSLHWFSQHNGAKQWTLWETSTGALRAFNGSNPHTVTLRPWNNLFNVEGDPYDGTTKTRTYVQAPNPGTMSQTWANRLYLVNGLDEPISFDGWRVRHAGYGTPAATPACTPLNETTTEVEGIGLGYTTTGDDKLCAYRYRMSYINYYGAESPPSPVSEQVMFENEGSATPPTRHGVWVETPTGPPGTVARRIWRTRDIADVDGNLDVTGRGATFYELVTITDNNTEGFEDWTPDTGLGPLLDDSLFGAWPSSAKYIAAFKNTMFLAGMTDSSVAFSRANRPEMFPAGNILQVGESDAGPITGLHPTRNALLVFKPRSIHLIRGDARNGFTADTLTTQVGCSAPNTIKDVPGLGVVFLADDGVHLLQGTLASAAEQTRTVPLSTPMYNWTQRLNRSAMPNACAAVYHRDKEYWLAVPMTGGADATTVLVFSYEVNSWSTRPNFPISALVAPRDHRGYLFFGSHDDTAHPGIHVYTPAATTKGASGPAVTPVYESVPHDLGSVYQHASVLSVSAWCIGYGDNDLRLRFRINRGLDFSTVTDDATRDQQNPEPTEDYTVLGETTWTAGVWSKKRPIVIRFDISTMRLPVTNEIQVTLEPVSSLVELVGYEIEVNPGASRNVKAITPTLGQGSR